MSLFRDIIANLRVKFISNEYLGKSEHGLIEQRALLNTSKSTMRLEPLLRNAMLI